MNVPAVLFSRAGRLAPGPFAISVGFVYLASFLSQTLLSVPVTERAGLWPFAVLQAALVWIWLALHIKRMRDAGRSHGMAIGIACLYALALLLLLLLMLFVLATGTSSDTAQAGQGLLHLFMVLGFIGLLLGRGDFGAFGLLLLGFGAVLAAPLLIALIYSIWAATRPRALTP